MSSSPFRARWLGLGAFVLFMVVASWFLANWQYDRWEQRKENNARAVANMALAPVPLDELFEANTIPRTAEWSNVELVGSFLTGTNVVLRYVRVNSQPGVQVVTPFELEDGRIVLVNRGWYGTQDPNPAADTLPAPPTGTVRVVGWWHPDNNAGRQATAPDEGSVRAIDSRQWDSLLGQSPVNGWVSWREPGQEGLAVERAPDLGEGPHLFYAIQWVVFGIMAVGGGIWFIRMDLRDRKKAQASETRSA